jgi:hypothetical protein
MQWSSLSLAIKEEIKEKFGFSSTASLIKHPVLFVRYNILLIFKDDCIVMKTESRKDKGRWLDYEYADPAFPDNLYKEIVVILSEQEC